MTNKEIVFKRLTNVLKGQAMYCKDNETIPIEDKIEELDIIGNLKEYLEHYDEYKQIISKYKKEKDCQQR